MEIKEIENKNNWEKFITDYAPQSLFQSWSWGEVIKKINKQKYNAQKLWRLGLLDNDKLVGIAQISLVEAKRGRFLHIRHGPILSSWSKSYFDLLIKYLRLLANKKKASFIRFSPLINNSLDNCQFFQYFNFINAPIHAMDGEYCWILDLDNDEDLLLKQMRKTTRYLIKQGMRLGIEIVKSKNIKDLDLFDGLYQQTAKRHHFVRHIGIKEEFTEFLKNDQILLFMGYYKKKLLSAALFIYYNHQSIYHHSASIEQKIPVNYLLQWEAIKEAKKRGMKIHNLWGIVPQGKYRHPWRGHTLFKTGFGGRVVEYLHAQDLPLSPLYCTTYIVEYLRRLYKGY